MHLPDQTCAGERAAGRTIVIVNASSGLQGSDPATHLREILRARGLSWEIWQARDGAELSRLAAKAAASSAEIIAAAGGDGTVNAVAAPVAHTEKIFAVLPLGTLNHFAKDLNIPLDLGRAIDNIIASNVAAVDVGEVNGRMFLNNSSIGLYPAMVARRELERKQGRPKWIAFIYAALRTLRQYVSFRVYVTADGARFSRRTPILFVGNNEYHIEGRSFGARSAIDRGRLSLYLLHHTGTWGLLKFSVRALFRRAWRVKDFDALQAREIEVATKRKRMRIAYDGEVAQMEMPLRYRIRPRALKVLVPAREPAFD
jgi:YegS/Rv2252/BmrU family lipid kinase